jgi:hypothetical protein
LRKPDPSAKPSKSCSPVLGIRAIVVRILIRNLGSAPLTNGTKKTNPKVHDPDVEFTNKKSQNIKMYVFLVFLLNDKNA